jgi:hypothetical protein
MRCDRSKFSMYAEGRLLICNEGGVIRTASLVSYADPHDGPVSAETVHGGIREKWSGSAVAVLDVGFHGAPFDSVSFNDPNQGPRLPYLLTKGVGRYGAPLSRGRTTAFANFHLPAFAAGSNP